MILTSSLEVLGGHMRSAFDPAITRVHVHAKGKILQQAALHVRGEKLVFYDRSQVRTPTHPVVLSFLLLVKVSQCA
jgi:hypothetical protein